MISPLPEIAVTSPSLPPTARFRPRPGVLSRELEGEAVLLDLAAGRYFSLNATGLRIWTLLGEGCGLGDIRDRLAAEYPLEAAQVGTDVFELCAALEEEGLVERVG